MKTKTIETKTNTQEGINSQQDKTEKPRFRRVSQVDKENRCGGVDKTADTCSFLKQENKWYPPYCLKKYCEKQYDYAGIKYCKPILESMGR